MDGERFDAITGVLGGTHSRRGVMRLLAAMAVGAATMSNASTADAKRKRALRQRKWSRAGQQLECELLGGSWTDSSTGGGTCYAGYGYYIICDSNGQCIRVCRVREGCDCDRRPANFCDKSQTYTPPKANMGPIGGEFTR